MKSFLHLFATVLLVFIVTDSASTEKRWNHDETDLPLNTSATLLPNDQQASVTSNNAPSYSNSETPGSNNGLFGGLLAGGILSYLLGSGAFEDIQPVDILLLAGIALLLFKLLRSDKSSLSVRAVEAGGYFLSSCEMVHTRKSDDLSRVMSGSQNRTINLPDSFDTHAFTQDALSYYLSIQTAWNTAELDNIRRYVSPALFERLARQHRELPQPPQTEVLDLSADILHADQSGTIRKISILFRGRCRDTATGADNGIFHTWYLEQDTRHDNAPWQIVCMDVE